MNVVKTRVTTPSGPSIRGKLSQSASFAAFVAIMASSGMAASPAQAQQERASIAASIPEIVVTARKREETLFDIPVSVTAFTNAQIEELGLRDPVDVALFTPGFSMQNISGGTEQPFIRGMSSTSFSRTEQTTSSFQDGVYSSGLGRTVFPGDIERIEIVKGPQSALFGRATFAGAINYITKKPTEEIEGEVRIGVGEFGRLDTHASISGPIIEDKLLFRVSGNTEQLDGQYINTLDDRKVGELHRYGVGGWMTAMPTDAITANLRVNKYWKRDDRQVPAYIQPSTTLNCFPDASGNPTYYCGELIVDPDFIGLNLDRVGEGFSNTNQTRATLDLDIELGDFTLTSQTGYVDEASSTWFDGDYTPSAVFGTLVNGTNENISQELRLTSPGGERFRYIVGGYYFKEDSTSALGAATPSMTDVKTLAVFGSMSYDLTDQLTVTFDARYQDEDQDFTSSGGDDYSVSTSSFLPRAIIEFQASENLNLYASVSRGSNPGRFNASTNVPADQILVDEELLWSYEVGAKSKWFDDKVSLNLAGYYIDWTDQAYRIEIVGTDGSVVNIFDNLGGSRIYGLEADMAAQLTDYWSIFSTFALTDAEYENFESANAQTVFGDPQVAGNELPNTPKYTFTASSNYQAPLPFNPDIDGFFRVDYSWRASQYVAEINLAETGDLNLLNLRAGVTNNAWRAEIALTNVLDDDTPEFATRFTDFGNFPFRFGYLTRLRQGRAIEGRVSYKF